MTYNEIKSLLMSLSDPAGKLEMLMDIGKDLPPIPPGHVGVEIKGCASRVEIFRASNGRFYGAADSAIVRGIVRVLLAMKESGAPFGEFKDLGLALGSMRLTGVASMIEYLEKL